MGGRRLSSSSSSKTLILSPVRFDVDRLFQQWSTRYVNRGILEDITHHYKDEKLIVS